MKLWRVTRPDRLSLDGAGAAGFGGRYSSPGLPIVSFASEAGLAVLVTLRYLEPTAEAFKREYVLGWITTDADVERIPDQLGEPDILALVDQWASSRRSLLIAIRSKVLPEADVVLMNPLHPGAIRVGPLKVRPFLFTECLHRPPMLDRYG